ncbi:MAG: DUF3737 family protein [Candidatus Coproplasma sp.]
MKKIIENATFDEERALYASKNLKLINVSFDGKADGESALKECEDIEFLKGYCNLRYPFWHIKNLKISQTEMTENCRASLWYCNNVHISNSKLFGIKAIRECKGVNVIDCDISSPELGWFNENISFKDCKIDSVYFLMRSKNVSLNGVEFTGKYSFQYVENAVIENSKLTTKDAFWHGKDITVKNCEVVGEYLGWYSENLTFENCLIKGTQPLCYCKNLRLINCRMEGCDFAFEKSEVNATVTTKIDSVRPYKGQVIAPEIGEFVD